MPERLVFSDVDETLIHCKSPLEFLGYYHRATGGEEAADRVREWTADLRARLAAGLSRAEGNRDYHRRWKDQPVAGTERWAERWFAERHRGGRGGLFVEETLRELRAHRAEGARLVLVSGSFPPLLAPIARAVGATDILCARLERRGRAWTGELRGEPVIGDEKRRLVRRFLAEHPASDPRDCFAYGDHVSDVPMLLEVGHRVMVGDAGADPALGARRLRVA